MFGKKYDVFISYRRGSGLYMAKNIATNLQNMGYSVFFDYDSMHNNEFDKQIYVAIKNSKDFILVLTENALDRCFLPDDWVAREVLYAKEHKKNIILATDAERFKNYPSNLPPSMDFLRKIDWTPIHPKLFEGSLKLLCKRLTSHTSKLRYLIYFISAVVLVALGILSYICYPPKTISLNIDEEKDFPIEIPAEFDTEEDVDDYESQYPEEDELLLFRSSSEKDKFMFMSFFVEDFEEINPEKYNWNDTDYEANLKVFKTYTIKDYISNVRKSVKQQQPNLEYGIETCYFDTGRLDWGLVNFVNKDENMMHWRFAAKITDTVYTNVIIVTPILNILQQQRFIFNAKRLIEKNDKVILKYVEEEYL